MGTTLAELLQHAQTQQQIENGRMDNVAAGGLPGLPTPDVQDIQARVAAGTQNQGAVPGEVNPADSGILGGLVKMLAPLFAGQPPAPVPPPAATGSPLGANPTPAPFDPAAADARNADCLKKTGQFCPD